MPFFEAPASLRLRELPAVVLTAFHQRRADLYPYASYPQVPVMGDFAMDNSTLVEVLKKGGAHSSHPDFLNLAGLVCEAVLEVVFVALPGYLVAVTGMFDANSQKFVAELNTMVFTPCLIFTKLASQLNADKLADLVVIPFIFAAQTLVSYACAQLMAWAFGFRGKEKKRQKNFVLAMGVFGNSNSLPISLVISLSKTISGLHWDQVPGDNDDEVAARGILYLLIFQQLGQLLRWTWGYSVLLKPAAAYEEDERNEGAEDDRLVEEGEYRDEPSDDHDSQAKPGDSVDSGFNSGDSTPDDPLTDNEDNRPPNIIPSTAGNGNDSEHEPRNLSSPDGRHALGDRSRSVNHMTLFPNFSFGAPNKPNSTADSDAPGWKLPLYRVKNTFVLYFRKVGLAISTFFANIFRSLPRPVQRTLAVIHRYNKGFWLGVWRQMNPPLWAMLAALIVASIPQLQHLFFTKGTLVSNSVTRAISQSGGVAVPLILVVLGANLARSTLPADQLATSPAEKAEERRLLYASILSRMVLPIIIMAPLLAVAAKFVPVSILDDPIFIVVCFLLTGAPSALQLAQICQINNVFMGAMSGLLVASYVVMIFPSTLLLVLLALEVLEWAVINN